MTNAERYARIADKNVPISLMLPVNRIESLRYRVANPFILLLIRILMSNRFPQHRLQERRKALHDDAEESLALQVHLAKELAKLISVRTPAASAAAANIE